MPVQTITTPAGERLVVLSEDEYEDLIDARDAEAAMREIEAGRMETLSDAELAEYLSAPTPLAFWRRRRGIGMAALAKAARIPESELARIESGDAQPDVVTLARLARHLRLRLESLIPAQDDDAA